MSKIFLAKIGASLMAIMLITACGNQDDNKKDETNTEQSQSKDEKTSTDDNQKQDQEKTADAESSSEDSSQ